MAFCGDCGYQLVAEKRFCMQCGARLEPEDSSKIASPASPWTEEEFTQLSQALLDLGIHPQQMGLMTAPEPAGEEEKEWMAGELFIINHRLSGALAGSSPEHFWWVDWWFLQRDRWALLRYRIDDQGTYVFDVATPGDLDMFMEDNPPSFEEIVGTIWLTTARFCARVFYPDGSSSDSLHLRISRGEEVLFLAIGRLQDFVCNAHSVVNETGLGTPSVHVKNAARKFLYEIPTVDIERFIQARAQLY